MNEGSSSGGGVLQVPLPTLHDHHHHQQQQLFQCHPPPVFAASGGVPMRYGAPSPNLGFQYFQHLQQHVINGHNNTIGGDCMLPSFGSGPPLLVGTPLETSKELSSIPNLHSQPECFDFCLKKTRFNEYNEKGSSNERGERALEIGPNGNGHDFLGFMPQSSAPSFVGETCDFYNKLVYHDAAASASAYSCATTPNLDECVEVVAVHRRGNSGSGRVFMEYEFFPVKDGNDTTSKELELPSIGSVVVGGAEASSITAAAYGDSASNYVDLSLRLSR
ncbi:hypothetical protein GLYMA_12G217800v4 [Glycine max]|uniref:Uncharacterized protein n=2 Tax=Glycine subgen. Soja TaxID=1462606 RepID=A0A0R0H8L3_SOYBN|nr:hypothetical protein GYH30_034527 [Glycine max]KRH27152.1 hypothetical protein GLYMA_12G217800v4 [Glycine max]